MTPRKQYFLYTLEAHIGKHREWYNTHKICIDSNQIIFEKRKSQVFTQYLKQTKKKPIKQCFITHINVITWLLILKKKEKIFSDSELVHRKTVSKICREINMLILITKILTHHFLCKGLIFKIEENWHFHSIFVLRLLSGVLGEEMI